MKSYASMSPEERSFFWFLPSVVIAWICAALGLHFVMPLAPPLVLVVMGFIAGAMGGILSLDLMLSNVEYNQYQNKDVEKT